MDRYIEWRKAKRFGCSLDGRHFRGLMPQTRLILTWKGGAYSLKPYLEVCDDTLREMFEVVI